MSDRVWGSSGDGIVVVVGLKRMDVDHRVQRTEVVRKCKRDTVDEVGLIRIVENFDELVDCRGKIQDNGEKERGGVKKERKKGKECGRTGGRI